MAKKLQKKAIRVFTEHPQAGDAKGRVGADVQTPLEKSPSYIIMTPNSRATDSPPTVTGPHAAHHGLALSSLCSGLVMTAMITIAVMTSSLYLCIVSAFAGLAFYGYFTKWLQHVDRSRSRLLQILEAIREAIVFEHKSEMGK